MMATVFLFILMLTTGLFVFMRRSMTAITLLGFTLLCFWSISSGMIASLLLYELQAPFNRQLLMPQWSTSNAIILLGAGTTSETNIDNIRPSIMAYSRINETARLYLNCIKSQQVCKVIISGGDALKVGISEAVVYQKSLLQLGVHARDIILEANSLNTYQNAEFTSAILKMNKFDQLLLVTSGVHMKRSLLYFKHFAISLQPAVADYMVAYPSFMPHGYHFALTDFAVHEYLGIARLHLYNLLGWNKKVTSSERSMAST
jgi:uncharacterized SAM-binding protein YcdF (DUF218 family)